MSNPGPPGEDERPLAGPDIGMGVPESGTQHATSTDFPPPIDAPAEPDMFATGTPPAARPTPPAYDDPAELVSSGPAYDAPTDLLDAGSDAVVTDLAAPTPAYDALAAESGFTPTDPPPTGGGGALAKVKAFADERPAAFLGAALVAGWLVGKLFGSSDDEDEG